MKARCADKRWQKWYKNIKVCHRWKVSYENFLKDVGERPSKHHSLDRIDSAKGYNPKNVRWATKSVQSRNTKIHCTNRSGIRGVSWSKSKMRYRAHISVKNKSLHLGYFDTKKEAFIARKHGELYYWKDMSALRAQD